MSRVLAPLALLDARGGAVASRCPARSLRGFASASRALRALAAPRPRRSRGWRRALTTETRDAFTRRDVREGDVVAYARRGRQKLGVVTGAPKRRLVPVLDQDGAKDQVELAWIDAVFDAAAIDPAAFEGNLLPRTAPSAFAALRDAVAFADEVVRADAEASGALVRAAWERAAAGASSDPTFTTAPRRAADLADAMFPANDSREGRADEAPSASAPASAPAPAAVDRPSSSIFASPRASPFHRAYATHRALSSNDSYFRFAGKGAFALRSAAEAASRASAIATQNRSDAETATAWATLRAIVRAPPEVRRPGPEWWAAIGGASRDFDGDGAEEGGDVRDAAEMRAYLDEKEKAADDSASSDGEDRFPPPLGSGDPRHVAGPPAASSSAGDFDASRDDEKDDSERDPPRRRYCLDSVASSAILASRVECLEAYASGDGYHVDAQRRGAADALDRLGMKASSTSARDALVALGKWGAFESVHARRLGVARRPEPSAVAEASRIVRLGDAAVPDPDAARRKAFTGLVTYAIDAEDAEEIDDAVGAEFVPPAADDDATLGRRIRCWVHVADASRWVSEGSALDASARARGSSGYDPAAKTPMFPRAFGAAVASLREGEARCAVTATAVIDAAGDVEEFWIGPSVAKVTRRMCEREALRALEDEPEKHPGLVALAEAARRRRARRAARGATNVDLPETNVRVERTTRGSTPARDEETPPPAFLVGGSNPGERAARGLRALEARRLRVTLERSDPTLAKLVVSEMMILAGELAGRLGAANGVALPYRGQAPMRDGAKVRGRAEVASAAAAEAAAEAGAGAEVSANSFSPVGIPLEMAKRSRMTAAHTGATPRRHASLGLDAYCQFTSPIRRYGDVLAHRQLKAFLRGDPPPMDEAEMARAARDVEEASKTTALATREAEAFWVNYWFATEGAEAGRTHRAVVAKWIHEAKGVCVAVFEESGAQRRARVDPKRAGLGDVVRLKVADGADPFAEKLEFELVE
jgi:exoribonuclease-2